MEGMWSFRTVSWVWSSWRKLNNWLLVSRTQIIPSHMKTSDYGLHANLITHSLLVCFKKSLRLLMNLQRVWKQVFTRHSPLWSIKNSSKKSITPTGRTSFLPFATCTPLSSRDVNSALWVGVCPMSTTTPIYKLHCASLRNTWTIWPAWHPTRVKFNPSAQLSWSIWYARCCTVVESLMTWIESCLPPSDKNTSRMACLTSMNMCTLLEMVRTRMPSNTRCLQILVWRWVSTWNTSPPSHKPIHLRSSVLMPMPI